MFVRKLPRAPTNAEHNPDLEKGGAVTSEVTYKVTDPTQGFTQLILLDHGLYRELNADLKYAYSLLWKGILNQNEANVEQGAKLLGVKNYFMFAAMITSKDWQDIMDKKKKDSTDRLAFVNDEKTKKDMQVKFRLYMQEILTCLQTMNNDVLLILKVNEYLRSIDHQLGNPVNSFLHIVD